MPVVAEKGLDGAVVADFIKAAKVSHGTFYNYFDSSDHLVEELAKKIEAEIIDYDDRLRASTSDLAQRIIVGVRLNIRRASVDADFTRFMIMLRMERIIKGVRRDSGVRSDIINAMQAGQIATQDVDLAVGTVETIALMGLCQAVDRRGPDNLDEHVAAITLCALGVPLERARSLASEPLPSDLPPVMEIMQQMRSRGRRTPARARTKA
jgi:AcrR family transcriptional regulator